MEVLEVDEKCHIHAKEQHIAVDDNSGVFGCNKCVFEKRIEKPLFMAVFARQTKKKFDDMFQLLLRSMTSIEDLTPSLVSQRIQSSINDFFNAIHRQMKEIEKDVLQQIKQSLALRELS